VSLISAVQPVCQMAWFPTSPKAVEPSLASYCTSVIVIPLDVMTLSLRLNPRISRPQPPSSSVLLLWRPLGASAR
jgi:hypothetical protein